MPFSAAMGPVNPPSSRLSLDRSNATGGASSSPRPVHHRIGADTTDENTIAVVNQELALLPHLTVAENIALPRLHRGWSLFSGSEARRIAVDALSLIDPAFAHASVDRLVADLSLHERQLVEIARALDSGASLLLLDEPTANLTAGETERLFTVLRRLTVDKGLAVLFVSHRMREIRQIADVCTIIRNGQTAVDRVALTSITDAEIVEQMGQAALGATQASPRTQRGPRSGSDDKDAGRPNALRIQTEGIDLQLPAGTILGLAGPPAGPETLMDALTGVSSAGRGRSRAMALPSATGARQPLRAMASVSSPETARTKGFSRIYRSSITWPRRRALSGASVLCAATRWRMAETCSTRSGSAQAHCGTCRRRSAAERNRSSLSRAGSN